MSYKNASKTFCIAPFKQNRTRVDNYRLPIADCGLRIGDRLGGVRKPRVVVTQSAIRNPQSAIGNCLLREWPACSAHESLAFWRFTRVRSATVRASPGEPGRLEANRTALRST